MNTSVLNKSTRALLFASTICLLNGCGGGGGGGTGGGGGPATHFSVTGPANAAAGTPFSFSVRALDASNNLATGYSGTLHLTSTDPHAQLPPDTKVNAATTTLTATFETAGNQTLTATDVAMNTLMGASAPINVGALADAFPVNNFGAKGDGHTDDTAAIQAAINAAAATGGGSVVLNMGRYFTAGTLVIRQGVVLCGAVEGPFDVPPGVNPATTTIAPTLLVTNTGGPFITLQGPGTGVTDLLFHYPNQVKTGAAAPTVYPFTILVADAGTKVARITVTNAYDFLDIEVGRFMAHDLHIGAFHNGVYIDHTADFVTMRHLVNTVYWDVVENASYPSTIDSWVLNNGTGMVINRMDSVHVSDFYVFSRFAGMLLTDSPDASQGFLAGYGSGSDIDLETVQYGIIVTSANSPGYKFTSVDVAAAPGLGQAAVQLRAGGTFPPQVEINGGSVRGSWATSAFPPPLGGGSLTVIDVIGFNVP